MMMVINMITVMIIIIINKTTSLSSYDEIENDIDTEILSYMKSYCPVSSNFDTEMDSIHGYPMDVFDNRTYMSIVNNTKSNVLLLEEYFFNCTSVERYDRMHRCSTLTRCPVTKDNILAATKRQRAWPISHSFCSLREKLKEPRQIINLIILGGSVTAGSGSWGWYERHHYHPLL